MNRFSQISRLVLPAVLTVVGLGCAGTGTRVAPPASSFEQLMAPGMQPPQVDIPSGASSQGAAVSNPAASNIPPRPTVGFASPASPVGTGAVVPAPPSISSGSVGSPPQNSLRAPESGFKTINPQLEREGNTTRKPPADGRSVEPIIRGQDAGQFQQQPPPNYPAGAGAPVAPGSQGFGTGVAPGFSPPVAGNGGQGLPAPGATIGPPAAPGTSGPWPPQSYISPTPDQIVQAQPTPLDILVEETRTGRFMFGVGVNSDAGVTGQITIDERNFDITKPPVSFDDFLNGTAWRGAGQGFRLEAQPGTRVQRYLASFTEPYLFNTQISMNTSGFYFDRSYVDWTESRLGGRLGFGYRLTPDLAATASIRAEDVFLHNPRLSGVPALDRSLGHTDVFGGKFALTHDTRDIPFMPTEGHMINVSFEQVFGEFSFPRFEADYAQYFMLRERPDGSGRHTLALTMKYGMMGSDAPIFEHYFAGGFSSLRGFTFRGAGPIDTTVRVGGRMQFLGSLEYFFPLTADDMIKGVAFCDFGTVEQDLKFVKDDFRVAPGFGLRVNVPALGPAPLAFDFAFPIAYQDTDDRQVFSFYVGFARQ